MNRSLKSYICIVLVFIILSSLVLVSSAADEVYPSLNMIKKYYEDNKLQPENLNETIIFKKTQIMSSSLKEYLVIDNIEDPIELSEFILALLATNNDPSGYNGINYTEKLKSMQKENGSFNDSFEATTKAIIAMNGSKVAINEEKAAEYILSFQQENGSFNVSDNIYFDTYLAVSALSVYSSESKAIYSSIGNAATFIKNTQKEGILPEDDLTNTAYAVLIVTDANDVAESNDYGNLVKSLLRFKNNTTGTFRNKIEDDDSFNRESTMLALKALEAVRSGACDYKTLGVNYSFNLVFDFEGLKPFLIGYGIAAVLSVIMWIVVLSIKKKKSQTLDDYKNEALKDVPVASQDDLNIEEK